MRVYKFMDAKFGLKTVTEKRLKISRIEDLNDPFELIPYNLTNKHHRRILQATRAQLAQNRGLLCFSTTWHDPVMWAHYSDKHRGLCLGFEVPKNICRSVTYESQRLPFPTSPTLVDAERMLFTKYHNWRYEKEIRVWVRLEDQEDGMYFYDFNKAIQLVQVIVGVRCTLSRKALVSALGTLAKSVKLTKARPGFRKFEIVTQQQGLN